MAKETKQGIIMESLRLFRKHGYNNVSVEDICASLGITRGTFYYHFKTKAAVLESIYVDGRERNPDNLSVMFSDDRWAQLCWLMEWTIELTESFGSELYRSLIATSLTEDIDIFRVSQKSRELLKQAIEAGQKSGQFKNTTDPQVLVDTILSIIIGNSVEWCYQNGAFSLKERNRKTIMALLQVQTA